MGRGGDEDPIPLPEDEITLRGDGGSAAQYRTDQHPAVDNAVHVAQRHVAQLAGLINAQLHDLHPPLGEGIPLQKARILQKIRNFLGGLLLRVDGHGQTEHILHGVDLLGILRIPDSGNGVQVGIQIVGSGAAQQVNLVRIRGGNQKICLLHACLKQDVHGHTVAGNRHHIVLLQGFLQNMGVLVDQGHIVTFGRQQPRQRGADLSVSRNDNVHKPLQIGENLQILFIIPSISEKINRTFPLKQTAARTLQASGRLFIYRQARLFSSASIFLMGSQMEETLISWLMAATK